LDGWHSKHASCGGKIRSFAKGIPDVPLVGAFFLDIANAAIIQLSQLVVQHKYADTCSRFVDEGLLEALSKFIVAQNIELKQDVVFSLSNAIE
jgi:hypothetical protein